MKCHLIKISVTIILLGLAAVGGFWYKKSFIDTAVQENGFNEKFVLYSYVDKRFFIQETTHSNKPQQNNCN